MTTLRWSVARGRQLQRLVRQHASRTGTPVARSSVEIRNRDDPQMVSLEVVNDAVGKAWYQHSSETPAEGKTDRREFNDSLAGRFHGTDEVET